MCLVSTESEKESVIENGKALNVSITNATTYELRRMRPFVTMEEQDACEKLSLFRIPVPVNVITCEGRVKRQAKDQ